MAPPHTTYMIHTYINSQHNEASNRDRVITYIHIYTLHQSKFTHY